MHLAPQRQVFAGMVAALDEAVGRVYQGFVDNGLDENLLIWFTTDNGGPVGSEHGHPSGIGCATGSQNYPLRGGKGALRLRGPLGICALHVVGTPNCSLPFPPTLFSLGRVQARTTKAGCAGRRGCTAA
jgi:hypothetical protein